MKQLKTNHMYTYKLEFENGKKMITKAEKLDDAHVKIIGYMEKENLFKCIIKCPNGIIRRVMKTGEWHWNHNGYSFD
jgi:hypothetical protein